MKRFQSLRFRQALISLLSFGATAFGAAQQSTTTTVSTNESDLGFFNPTLGGGKWLTTWNNDWAKGEPINAVISSKSDPFILSYEGLIDYCHSLRFSTQCFQFIDDESFQGANLGDGNGVVNQTMLLRYNYDDPTLGTCSQTIQGGNHIRIFRQNGTQANTGAWFFAASKEHNLLLRHMIIPNGYDRGRDEIVQIATTGSLDTDQSSPSSNTSTRSPVRPNRSYRTTVESVSGQGYFGLNPQAKDFNHDIATDGRIAVLTVQLIDKGDGDDDDGDTSGFGSEQSTGSWFSTIHLTEFLIVVGTVLFLFISLGLFLCLHHHHHRSIQGRDREEYEEKIRLNDWRTRREKDEFPLLDRRQARRV